MQSHDLTVNRRSAMLGATGALALLALSATAGKAAPSRAIQSGGGVAGGGTIAVGDTTATFSVFASRFTIEGEDQPLLFGSINWMDASGFGFTATEVEIYGQVEGDVDTAREIEGTAKLTDGAEQPFRLYVVERGGLGVGGEPDDIGLTVGPADNTVYRAKGKLATGDILLIPFTFADDAADATPAAT